jgi:hypothetical protein
MFRRNTWPEGSPGLTPDSSGQATKMRAIKCGVKASRTISESIQLVRGLGMTRCARRNSITRLDSLDELGRGPVFLPR